MTKEKDLKRLVEHEIDARTKTELEKIRPAIEAEARKAFEAAVEKRMKEVQPDVRRKVCAELVRTLFTDEIGAAIHVEDGPLTPETVKAILDHGIAKEKHGWRCQYCGIVFDTQRAATIHARSCAKRPQAQAQPEAEKTPRSCIKPGCKHPSKGPRFHFLCEKHLDAPAKQWKVWKQKDRDSRV